MLTARRSEDFPMRFDEGLPRSLAFPVRRRFDSVFLEYVADRRVGDVVADIGQGTLDTVISPGRVFLGESKNQVNDHLSDSRAARLLPA